MDSILTHCGSEEVMVEDMDNRIIINDAAVQKLSADLSAKLSKDFTTKLQPSLEAFEAEWSGKPEAEVEAALRAHLVAQGLKPNDTVITDMARKIANG